MAWLREWISLLESEGFAEAVLPACGQKEFRFLLYGLLVQEVERHCTRDHSHVRIQGKYTKDSAIYFPATGMHLALALKNAFRRAAGARDPEWTLTELESVVSNDLVQTSRVCLVLEEVPTYQCA